MMKTKLIGTVGICLLASAPLCFASDISNSPLHVKHDHGISYLSGGFGTDDRAALRAMGREDNVEMSFALQDKEYLGGAKVLVRDEQGKEVLKADSDGPLFFTKLPPGTYTVEATAMDKTVEQMVRVPSKGQAHLHFAWKDSGHESAVHAMAKK